PRARARYYRMAISVYPEPHALSNLAGSEGNLGHPENARRLARQSIEASRRQRKDRPEALAQRELAFEAREANVHGDYAAAAAAYKKLSQRTLFSNNSGINSNLLNVAA